MGGRGVVESVYKCSMHTVNHFCKKEYNNNQKKVKLLCNPLLHPPTCIFLFQSNGTPKIFVIVIRDFFVIAKTVRVRVRE